MKYFPAWDEPLPVYHGEFPFSLLCPTQKVFSVLGPVPPTACIWAWEGLDIWEDQLLPLALGFHSTGTSQFLSSISSINDCFSPGAFYGLVPQLSWGQHGYHFESLSLSFPRRKSWNSSVPPDNISWIMSSQLPRSWFSISLLWPGSFKLKDWSRKLKPAF